MADGKFSTDYPQQFPTFNSGDILTADDLKILVAGIEANHERVEAKIGTPGPSAYDIAVLEKGYQGTVDEWLESLKVKGDTGEQGPPGKDGTSVTILGSVSNKNELPNDGNNKIGDGYLVNGVLYVWNGSNWVETGEIQGPQGKSVSGATIEDGKLKLTIINPANNNTTEVIEAGQVVGSQGPQGKSISNASVDANGYLTLTLKDPAKNDEESIIRLDTSIKGQDGSTPRIEIGNTTTLAPDENASVQMDNTDTGVKFSFSIPKGEQGTGLNIKASKNDCTEIGDGYINDSDGSLYIRIKEGDNGFKSAGRIMGPEGPAGRGISSITKGTNDLTDTYTINYTDDTTFVFTVTNGAKGEQGQSGTNGQNGETPYITADGYWQIGNNKTSTKAAGTTGATGTGISSIVQTTTSTASGGENIITISLTNNEEKTFSIRNGSQGNDGATPYIEDGYWYINGTDTEVRAISVLFGTNSNPTAEDCPLGCIYVQYSEE